jgi:DNA-directed RNA polymerase subunit M/transcription elongation factor TFIIS
LENLEVKLGKNKIVEVKPWKTKTKKDFLKIVKAKQLDIVEEDLVNSLVLPYVTPNDIYFSSDEIQYLLVILREISINENIITELICKKCNESFDVSKNVKDFCKYQTSQYPVTIGKYTWRDIKSSNSVQNISKKHPDELQNDIEMLLHIEAIDGKMVESFEEILDYFENLELDESKTIYEDYDKVKSKLSLEFDETCPKCGDRNTYYFETIPNFFDPLLPKV